MTSDGSELSFTAPTAWINTQRSTVQKDEFLPTERAGHLTVDSVGETFFFFIASIASKKQKRSVFSGD